MAEIPDAECCGWSIEVDARVVLEKNDGICPVIHRAEAVNGCLYGIVQVFNVFWKEQRSLQDDRHGHRDGGLADSKQVANEK